MNDIDRDNAIREDFRAAMGTLAGGVGVVTTCVDSIDHAMTVTAVTSVSLEPPLLMVAAHRDSRFRAALENSPGWALSILTEEGRGDATWLATPGRPTVDQLAQVPHRRGEVTGAALLERSLATVECLTEVIHSAGDHDLVIGRVASAVLVAPSSERNPLVYHQRNYWKLEFFDRN